MSRESELEISSSDAVLTSLTRIVDRYDMTRTWGGFERGSSGRSSRCCGPRTRPSTSRAARGHHREDDAAPAGPLMYQRFLVGLPVSEALVDAVADLALNAWRVPPHSPGPPEPPSNGFFTVAADSIGSPGGPQRVRSLRGDSERTASISDSVAPEADSSSKLMRSTIASMVFAPVNSVSSHRTTCQTVPAARSSACPVAESVSTRRRMIGPSGEASSRCRER